MTINKQIYSRINNILMLIVGVIFFASGCSKIYRPFDFIASVYNYELLSPNVGVLVALILPWFEIICGVSLILNIAREGVLLGLCLIGFVFVYAQSYALIMNLKISCGCMIGFGEDNSISYSTLFRAIFIFLWATVVYSLPLISKVRGE